MVSFNFCFMVNGRRAVMRFTRNDNTTGLILPGEEMDILNVQAKNQKDAAQCAFNAVFEWSETCLAIEYGYCYDKNLVYKPFWPSVDHLYLMPLHNAFYLEEPSETPCSLNGHQWQDKDDRGGETDKFYCPVCRRYSTRPLMPWEYEHAVRRFEALYTDSHEPPHESMAVR